MERIQEEQEEIEYRSYQHFISNSPWDHQGVIRDVSRDVSLLIEEHKGKEGKPTGLIIDESSHLKKGKCSVGVARQYAGIIGKVDNCQVGVYGSLVNDKWASFVSERLFLPQSWVDDSAGCEKAKIPKAARQYKTKLELALDMIDELIESEVKFDWVGGDGLYGHSYEFGKGLDDRNLLFVLDVHKDQQIFLSEPLIYLPQKQSGRGRPGKLLKTDASSIRVDSYAKDLEQEQWEKVKIRKTTKGWLKGWMHLREVWVWDKKEEKARKRTLIIRKDIAHNGEKPKWKYSLSNGPIDKYSKEEFAYFQAQRYWIERNFDDAKNELGLSDYQVRKWLGWHHHHAILFMAMLFMLKERMSNHQEFPLMSIRDARIMVTTLIAQTMIQTEPQINRQIRLMKIRHEKRKKDIDRYFIPDS